MRHRRRSRRLVGKWEHRQALLRNLLNSLFTHEKITTTLPKAKELRRVADRIITLAKRGDLHARRQALAVLQNKTIVRKIFQEAQERFGDRQGGYTRIVKLGPRRGDAAMMAIVELVAEKLEYRRSKKKIQADKEALAMAPTTTKTKSAEEGKKEELEDTIEETQKAPSEPGSEESGAETEAKSEAETSEDTDSGQEETAVETSEDQQKIESSSSTEVKDQQD